MKKKKIEEEEDEDSEQEIPTKKFKSIVQVGDLIVGGFSDLKHCKRVTLDLLKNKQVSKYLGFYSQQKQLKGLSYID